MKLLFAFLFCCVIVQSETRAQSFHTVTFTGSSGDFNTAERISAAANNTDYYITFDATYLYIGGFRTSGTFGGTDAFTVFIDTDPQPTPATAGNGTTTGNLFNNVTPTLPFRADFATRVEQSYEETRQYTGSWGADLNYETVFTNSTARELRLSWANLGSPAAVYITVWMGYNGGNFSNAPGADVGASGTPTFTNYFGGFGSTSSGCIPKNITNTPITASGTNVAASGATYGTLTISSNTTAAGNFAIASGGSLALAGGLLTLGANTLTMATGSAITGASSASYVVADGAGLLRRNDVGATSTIFPVGTATTYNPVTIANTGTADDFSVSVKGSFDNAPNDPTSCLTRQWTINEAAPGGSNASVTLQFNASNPRGALFDPAQPIMYIGRFPTAGPWLSTLATKGGSDPYTLTATFTAFSAFGVTTNASALPVQLASFTATFLGNGAVRLNWRTVSETNNYGFYVQRKRQSETQWTEVPNSFVAGYGTTNEPQNYSYTDNNAAGQNIQYRLKQVDLDGTIHYSEPITVSSPTSVNDVAPQEFSLKQNYPNPFNPETNIEFSVEKSAYASLEIFNVLGERVATLYNAVAEAGKFYTVRFDASNVAGGTYFYRLSVRTPSGQSGANSAMKKFVLVK